jgi:hypothetical protein
VYGWGPGPGPGRTDLGCVVDVVGARRIEQAGPRRNEMHKHPHAMRQLVAMATPQHVMVSNVRDKRRRVGRNPRKAVR